MELECKSKEQIHVRRLFPNSRNSFTYEMLVKPEAVLQVHAESGSGTSGVKGQRYVVSPEHGRNPQEAGVGISVGTNGVAVYEHTNNHLAPTLVCSVPLHDWVYITVVFRNKLPYLYLNGQFVKKGVQSSKNSVVASGVFGGHNPYGYFQGKIKYVKLWNYARSEAEVKRVLETTVEDHTNAGLIGYWRFHTPPAFDQQSFNRPLSQLKQKGILFVMNNIGGGTAHYLQVYLEKMKHEARAYLLTYEPDLIIIEDLNHTPALKYTFPLAANASSSFGHILRLLNIQQIFINHLIRFPLSVPALFQVMELIQGSGVEYVYYSQDFFCACPLVNLLNQSGVYCNSETNVTICQACVKSRYSLSIQQWRSRFSSFLTQAGTVFVASESTKTILSKYYPNLRIELRPLPVPSTIQYTFQMPFALSPTLNIAFIGNIQHNKGSKVLYELVELIRQEGLPVAVKVIGITDRHHTFRSQDGILTVTGPYNNSEISQLLANYHVAIVIASSICPETFSYTASEALESGYPVISFDIGATGEKVRQSNGGWIAPSISARGIMQALKPLLTNRGAIVEKANILAAQYKR